MIRSLVLATLLFLVGCSDKDRPNVELIQDMMDSPAVKAQDYDLSKPDKRAMRIPPEHSLPRDFKPYPYVNQPEKAEAQFVNPIAGQLTPPILTIGQKRFETFCMVCHGEHGKGDGTVAPKFIVKPPSLLSDKVRNFKDGRIFHIMSEGQGLMGSYAYQIPKWEERWAVVNYIRSLQKQYPATK